MKYSVKKDKRKNTVNLNGNTAKENPKLGLMTINTFGG